MDAIQINRMRDESNLDYHKRLIYGKLVDKTLADMDYTELAELVYGQPYSSDVARRMMYGSRRTLELIDKEKKGEVSDDGILSEIDEKIIELRKERQKFYDQRREYNRLISIEAREEHLRESLITAANNLRSSVGNMYDRKYNETISKNNTEAVLVFSDWHFGLKTSNIFNHFDTEICRQRVKHIVGLTVSRLVVHQCNRLHVIVLGDLCHGAIHNSARVASEELVCDQIMQASEMLAQSVEYLSRYVDETIVYATYGNHARTTQNKNDSVHRDNMERLVPWWLKQRLADYKNITIADDNGSEFIFANVCGYDICASHGDNDSVRSAPRLLTTLFQKKHKKDIAYIVLGDKHHRESFEELGVTAVLCGSLCGTDDYANDKRLYSDPSQLLMIFSPDVGMDAEYRLKCK